MQMSLRNDTEGSDSNKLQNTIPEFATEGQRKITKKVRIVGPWKRFKLGKTGIQVGTLNIFRRGFFIRFELEITEHHLR